MTHSSEIQRFDVSAVVSQLLQLSLTNTDLQFCLDQACWGLVGCGIPLERAHLSVNTLHPLFQAVSSTWNRDQDISQRYYPHDPDREAWSKSPFFFMIQNHLMELRRHLRGSEAMLDFPILEEFAAQGFTDYRAYLSPFLPMEEMGAVPEGLAGSWSTRAPGGFSVEQLKAMREVEVALSVAGKVHMESEKTTNILNTYLGGDAGQQVRRGRIKRGDVESVNAVIWYSDMRGSTERAARLSGVEFLTDINDYFSCTAGGVMDSGGEVLRFIGDAVLAIFPTRDAEQEQQAFINVVRALKMARQRMDETNRQRERNGKDALSYGVAVHFGEVLYGNIGAPERLEFTVVGRAANEVARMESMTKTLALPTLLSEAVASRVDLKSVNLGDQEIQGSNSTVCVYGVADDQLV